VSIQNSIRSAWVIVIVVALLALAVVFRAEATHVVLGKTLSRTTGIVDFVPRANSFLPKLHSLIEDAKEEVWFIGVSFYISLPENKADLLAALERGVDVRFLVYNPLSADLAEVADGFSQSPEELLGELTITIENLRALQNEAARRRTKGDIQIRLFSSIPKMRIYAFDRRSSDGVTFFIPHVDQQNSPTVPGFLANNIPTGVVPPLLEGAERLWARSTPFSDFIRQFDQK